MSADKHGRRIEAERPSKRVHATRDLVVAEPLLRSGIFAGEPAIGDLFADAHCGS